MHKYVCTCIHICIYEYTTYIFLRRPLVGHQAVEDIVSIKQYYILQSIQSGKLVSLQPCNLYQYCKFTSLRPFGPFKASYLRSYSFIACIFQPECFEATSLLPSWMNTLPPTWRGAGFGFLQAIPEKSLNFKPVPNTLKITKSLPKVTKRH